MQENVMQLQTVLKLANEEYYYILKDGWKETINDNNTYWDCCGCSDELKVLGYANTQDTLSNGIDQETIDTMTTSDCLCGYFGCTCRYHLKCLMKRICDCIAFKEWKCDYHQRRSDAFFIADNFRFPDRQYAINQIDDEGDYNEKFDKLNLGIKRHLTLVNRVCKEFNIHFASVMLSLHWDVLAHLPYNI
jgi:hypothetical protein